MDILRDSVVFVLFLSLAVVAKHNSTHIWNSRVAGSEHKWYDIYYDVISNKRIPIVQRFGERQDEPNTARFGRIPCSCQNLTCGCCAQFNVRLLNYNKRGCMNFTYDPSEFSVRGNMYMDNESKYEYKLDAKNPPPLCMPVPVPYVPSMEMCLKMFDMYTSGRNLHACVNFLTRLERAEILVLEFDCFMVGRDGVKMQKFNASTAAAPAAVYDAMATDEGFAVTEAGDTTAVPDLDFTVIETYDTAAPDLDVTTAGPNDTAVTAPELDVTTAGPNDTAGRVLRLRAVA